jgi:hypothetical protein
LNKIVLFGVSCIFLCQRRLLRNSLRKQVRGEEGETGKVEVVYIICMWLCDSEEEVIEFELVQSE